MGTATSEAREFAFEAVDYAQVPRPLWAWAGEQVLAFADIVGRSLHWPIVGCWFARRRLKRAQARGALALTAREFVIVANAYFQFITATKGLPPEAAGATACQIIRRLGFEWEVIEQVPLECAAFARDVIKALRPETNIDPDVAAALARASGKTK